MLLQFNIIRSFCFKSSYLNITAIRNKTMEKDDHEHNSNREKLMALRVDYSNTELLENNVDPDPIKQFDKWLNEAVAANLNEPNGMVISTATADGKPSSRVVLLKDYDDRGFVFFTNYNSRKGSELAENPYIAALFWWGELDRSVRIEGKAEQVSREETEKYFHSRPVGARIGAWASAQSTVLQSREELEQKTENLKAEYGVSGNESKKDIPAPPHWGGVRIVPYAIEFWKGRPSRLHDRLKYFKNEDGKWTIKRLSP